MEEEIFNPIARLRSLCVDLERSRQKWLKNSGIRLSPAQIIIIGCLADSKKGMPALEKETGISHSYFRQEVGKLRQAGLVVGVMDRLDKRILAVELTKEGQICKARLDVASRAWARHTFDQLPPGAEDSFWATCRALSRLAARGSLAAFLSGDSG